jgi:aminoglycoside phosphotransferase (APT) family kinase protein
VDTGMSGTREPGRIIASGRDGDIFEFGPDLVLRKSRDGRSLEAEVRVMEYAREHGYPVPAVHEVRAAGSEVIMERIAGPMMVDAMLKRPWTMASAATTLADLHDQLHAISGPKWLRQMPDDGDRLLHLDLHPLNIIVSPERGPVVIDWSNAARGDALTDVGNTYVLLTCPQMPGPAVLRAVAKPLRAVLASRFAKRYRGPDLDAHIADAAELKTLDDHMSPEEIAAMRRLAARMRNHARSEGR